MNRTYWECCHCGCVATAGEHVSSERNAMHPSGVCPRCEHDDFIVCGSDESELIVHEIPLAFWIN